MAEAEPTCATIALLVHSGRPEAVELARSATAWLVGQGHDVRLPPTDAERSGLSEHAWEEEQLSKGLNLAVSLGGDGTMLRTVDLVADDRVPVLGVNLGQLGYLTEIEPAELTTALTRFLAGDYAVEERMRLAVEVDAPSCAGPRSCVYPALNEAVVGKTPTGQIVRLDVSIDGEYFTTYHADGLILATPTGSTAYAWSAGGPIMAPTHQALLLTPVAPHMLFDRSLVLAPATVVRLEVLSERPATLSVDGRNLGLLEAGDAIACTAATHPARLVTFGGRAFFSILKGKFGLSDRIVN